MFSSDWEWRYRVECWAAEIKTSVKENINKYDK